VAVTLLVLSGALASDFSGFEDEPAHLMSSLMLRDYLVGGLPGPPVAWAKDYYLHYPKVTIGHWPPVLPALLGAWTTVCGTSHFAILSCFCVLAAAVATTIHVGARALVGSGIAALAGLAWLLVPVVQRYGHMTLTELLLALFCTLAVLAFARFLEDARARHSLCFALFAVAAILTKGSGVFLALVPPLALAMTGRWRLLARPALWLAPLVVGLCTAPWYLATIEISTSSWVGGSRPTLAHAWRALGYYPRELFLIAGPLVGGLALVGLAAALASRERRCKWAAQAAWLPSLILCHMVVSTGPQTRHLVLLVPVWLSFAALGARFLAERLPRLALGRVHLAPAAFALALVPFLDIERKDCRGYAEAARMIIGDSSLVTRRLLIDSDSRGEGGFVSAIALNEQRPGHVVLRGSKVLAYSDWMGTKVEPLFGDEDAMQAWLAEYGVEIVAIDDSIDLTRLFEHDRMLRRLVSSRAAWSPYASIDMVRDGVRTEAGLKLFRQALPAEHEPSPLRFEDVVGRELPAGHY
jgi:uncharacterized membrane protein